jgi:hypothetical protein
MADDQKEEDKKPEIDQSLGVFLMKNRFNIKNIHTILEFHKEILNGNPIAFRMENTQLKFIPYVVNSQQELFTKGCIFILPSGRRDGKSYVIWSQLSSEEIKRIVALKAFL